MKRYPGARLGAAIGEMAVVACAVLTLGGLSVYVVPRVISAAGDGGGAAVVVEAPSDPGHAAVFEGIREIFERSRAVVRVWDHGGGSVDVLLWLGDSMRAGSIERGELVLVSFSGVLETVNAYVVEGEGGAETVELGAFGRGRFPDVWRRSDGVEGRVVATGVRVARFTQAEEGAGMVRLGIALRWGSRGADGTISEARFEALLLAVQGLDAG